jgi:hypothetical protein
MSVDSTKTGISISELFIQIVQLKGFVLSKWKKIFLGSFLGGVLGFVFAFLTPVNYVAKTTFVVEESKAGGGLASLAGQFGFDIGGVGSGGGVFSGDNILLFLKSESLCREALMTPYDSSASVVLADIYAESTGLKKQWRKNKKIGEVSFARFIGKPMPRKEDSLIQYIIKKRVIENDLYVYKPDKKASFINVTSIMRDEMLSKLFTERLVQIATKLYVESKTKVKQANVNMLQRRADSLLAILNNKTFKAASSQQNLIDINPALRTAPISAEISNREKTMVGTIFAEVVKNLEISKTILSQEVPAIQIVDESSLPLEKKKLSKLVYGVLGGMLFGILFILYFMSIFWIRQYIKPEIGKR